MDFIRHFDWYTSEPDTVFITEHELDNSCIEKILRFKFFDPNISSDEEEERPVIDWKQVFKRESQEHKHRRVIAGLRPLTPHPRLSALSRDQHMSGLKLLSVANPHVLQTEYMRKPTKNDAKVMEEMKEAYKAEQIEYIEWAKTMWINGQCIRALRPAPTIETVYEREFSLKAAEMQSFPKSYGLAAQICYEPREDCELVHVKDLISIKVSDLHELEWPQLTSNKVTIFKPCPMPQPCNKHPTSMVLPNEKTKSVLPLTEVHRSLAQYAAENGARVVASERALQCLGAKSDAWALPLTVAEGIGPDGVKSSVLVIGSEFYPKQEYGRTRTYRAMRHLLHHALVPPREKVKIPRHEKASGSKFFEDPDACLPSTFENKSMEEGSDDEDQLVIDVPETATCDTNDTESDEDTALRIVENDTASEKIALQIVENDTKSEETALQIVENDTTSEGTALQIVENDTASEGTALKIEENDTASEETALKIVESDTASEETALQIVENDTVFEEIALQIVENDTASEETVLQIVENDTVSDTPLEKTIININKDTCKDLIADDESDEEPTIKKVKLDIVQSSSKTNKKDDDFYKCTCKDTIFEMPPPTSFRKWQLRNSTTSKHIDIIVHCTHKTRNSNGEVILEPIPEHQIELGASEESEDRLRALALSLALRSAAAVITARVDAVSGEVVTLSQRSGLELPAQAEDVIGCVHAAAEQLTGLVPGHYVLKHEPNHGHNALLYAPNQRSDNLTLEFDSALPADEAVNAKVPIKLTPALLPMHKFRKFLPLCFTPYPNQVAKPLNKPPTRNRVPPQAIRWPKGKGKHSKKNRRGNARSHT